MPMATGRAENPTAIPISQICELTPSEGSANKAKTHTPLMSHLICWRRSPEAWRQASTWRTTEATQTAQTVRMAARSAVVTNGPVIAGVPSALTRR